MAPPLPGSLLHSRSPRRRLALAALLLAVAGCAALDTDGKTRPPAPARMAELWIEPADLERRDLFWGPGGEEQRPDREAVYRFREMDERGHSDGYEVEGPDGRRWKVKVGDEAQAEIVVSRILWAIGYHQPALYYLRSWRMSGGPTESPPPGRFRLESDHDKKGQWSWVRNPFAGTRELHGLLVANLVLANWDLDRDNNRIYVPEKEREKKREKKGEKKGAAPARQPVVPYVVRYVVQDVGGALGKSKFPIGTRNSIDDFESEDLVEGTRNGRPDFDYASYHRYYDKVGVEDTVWACRLLARLSDEQLEDAFRAAQYPPEIAARYIRKIRQKIGQGLALESERGARP
jgi:hypothetical protein